MNDTETNVYLVRLSMCAIELKIHIYFHSFIWTIKASQLRADYWAIRYDVAVNRKTGVSAWPIDLSETEAQIEFKHCTANWISIELKNATFAFFSSFYVIDIGSKLSSGRHQYSPWYLGSAKVFTRRNGSITGVLSNKLTEKVHALLSFSPV